MWTKKNYLCIKFRFAAQRLYIQSRGFRKILFRKQYTSHRHRVLLRAGYGCGAGYRHGLFCPHLAAKRGVSGRNQYARVCLHVRTQPLLLILAAVTQPPATFAHQHTTRTVFDQVVVSGRSVRQIAQQWDSGYFQDETRQNAGAYTRNISREPHRTSDLCRDCWAVRYFSAEGHVRDTVRPANSATRPKRLSTLVSVVFLRKIAIRPTSCIIYYLAFCVFSNCAVVPVAALRRLACRIVLESTGQDSNCWRILPSKRRLKNTINQ